MRRPVFFINVLLVVVFLATLAFSLPYVISAIYLYQGNLSFEQALQELGLDPRDWDINQTLATSPPPTGVVATRLDQAVTNLQRAVWWDRKNLHAYHPLVEAYLLQRNMPTALETAATLTRLAPEDRQLSVTLGNVYAQNGDLEQALALWNKGGAKLSRDNLAAWQITSSIRLPATAFLPSQRGGAGSHFVGSVETVLFLTDDTIERPFFFPATGLYTIRVRAQHGTPPPIQLIIRQDGKSVALLSYGNGDNEWGTQEAAIPVSYGLHWIGIRYANDYNVGSIDRNAIVEWIEIAKN